MADYISREAAIAAFSTNGSVFVYGQKACKAIISRLKLIPAADVQPVVHGEWVSVRNGYGVCSNCNRGDHIDPLARFCRFCGADMREDRNGTP